MRSLPNLILQVIGAALLSSLCALATAGFRSWINAFWMIGLPITIAVVFNRRTEVRIIMALLLTVISVLSTGVTASRFGFGP